MRLKPIVVHAMDDQAMDDQVQPFASLGLD
jgi:hypothetical protein